MLPLRNQRHEINLDLGGNKNKPESENDNLQGQNEWSPYEIARLSIPTIMILITSIYYIYKHYGGHVDNRGFVTRATNAFETHHTDPKFLKAIKDEINVGSDLLVKKAHYLNELKEGVNYVSDQTSVDSQVFIGVTVDICE